MWQVRYNAREVKKELKTMEKEIRKEAGIIKK